MKIAINIGESVSAVDPLNELSRRVRLLERQAARARKILNSAEALSATGRSITTAVARLQEVLDGTQATAPSKMPVRVRGTADVAKVADKGSAVNKFKTRLSKKKLTDIWSVVEALGPVNSTNVNAAAEALGDIASEALAVRLNKQLNAELRRVEKLVTTAVRKNSLQTSFSDDGLTDRLGMIFMRGKTEWDAFAKSLQAKTPGPVLAAVKKLNTMKFWESYFYVFNGLRGGVGR